MVQPLTRSTAGSRDGVRASVTDAVRRAVAGRIRATDVDFVRRGFVLEPGASRAHLEQRAAAFVAGARASVLHPVGLDALLARTGPELRGFQAEGAGMAACMLDALELGTGRRVRALLDGEAGHRYRHLIHVGVGWGVAQLHLPWSPSVRDLDPLLRWLALDGIGFRELFFGPGRAVGRWRDWPQDLTDHQTVRATGHGRALWFACNADVGRIASVVSSAPGTVRPALWAGVGLAAAYASRPGGVPAASLLAAAGPATADLAQGVVFGAAARSAHGHVPRATHELAVAMLGIDAATAGTVADQAAARAAATAAGIAAFQTWRHLLREQCWSLLEGRTTS